MTELSDAGSLIGALGEALPKLSASDRNTIRQALKSHGEAMPGAERLRAYAAAKLKPPSNLLQASTLQAALPLRDLLTVGPLLTLVTPRADATAWLSALRLSLTETKTPPDGRLALRISTSVARWFGALRHHGTSLTADSTVELLRLVLPLGEHIYANTRAALAIPAIANLLTAAITAILDSSDFRAFSALPRALRTMRRSLGDGAVAELFGREELRSLLPQFASLSLECIPALLSDGATDTLDELFATASFLRLDRKEMMTEALRLIA